jgi:ribonuclease Z
MDLDEERSKSTFHSTGGMAARIAKDSDVKQLLIGHFSARYKDLKPLLIEAQSVFPNTQLALEGETFEI